MENHENAASPIQGIHISWMNAAIIIMSLILYILLTITSLHVSKTTQASYDAMNDFSNCTQLGELFLDGSNYLTRPASIYPPQTGHTWTIILPKSILPTGGMSPWIFYPSLSREKKSIPISRPLWISPLC